MKTPTFITAYGPKIKVTLACDPAEGKTKQEFKDDCDINVILARFRNSGALEHINRRKAQFADCTVSAYDFQHAMDVLADAKSAFQNLPAALRDRFDNDPAELLAFVEDDDNQAEAGDLGLLSPEGMASLAAKAAKEAAAAAKAAAASVNTTTPLPAATKGS